MRYTEKMNHKSHLLPVILAALLIPLLLWGCSQKENTAAVSTPAESEKTDQKVRIGISFDSFVIERWLRDRDVFTATAQNLGAEVNVQNASGEVQEQIGQIEYLIDKGSKPLCAGAFRRHRR